MSQPARLSRAAGRGAVINLLFGLLTTGLAAVQGVIVPRLLGPGDVGLFAVASGGVAIGTVLKQIDLPRKVVQERDVDLHTSFRVAFTLEIMLAGAFLAVVLILAPILAYAYDRPELWLLTSVLGATVFSTAFLDLPASIPYREMNFLSRNLFTSVGPVVTFLVTVPAAVLGAGVWSLVAGTVAGFIAAAVVVAFFSPIKPGIMWDKAVARRFVRFGWPVWLSGVAGLVAAWGTVFAVSATIGVAAVGYFTVAQAWSNRALQIDVVLGDTVFPALCSMQSSLERLRRAFMAVTRISMLWAAPVGFALALFAAPIVNLLLGPAWEPAVLLMQAEGLGVIVNSIGNSWYLFYGARGETKPWLVQAICGVVWTVVFVIPLLIVFGLDGAAMAIVALALGSHALRQYYTTKLFGRLVLVTLVWRELLAGLVPAAILLAVRRAGWEATSLASTALQIIAYMLLAALTALVVSRTLLQEVWNALRRRPSPAEPTGDEPVAPAAGELRRIPTPRRMAFPLLTSADQASGAVWVSTRDWPALGRMDIDSGSWQWHELPSFPHAPSPDGHGGCWSALTRSSALAHVDSSGVTRLVELPRSRELLVSIVHERHVWAVDAQRLKLLRYDPAAEELSEHDLPIGFARPDFVAAGPDGALWVADTRTPCVAVVSGPAEPTPGIRVLEGPHPSRAVIADPAGAGVWLGAADRACASLLSSQGDVVVTVDLPGVPFGMCALGDGRLAAAIKVHDLLAIIEPVSLEVQSILLPEGSLPMGCTAYDNSCFVTLAGLSELAELVVPISLPATTSKEPVTPGHAEFSGL